MAYLKFISDMDLENHIKNTLSTYSNTIKSINLSKFNSNIIDPIKLTFDSNVYSKNIFEKHHMNQNQIISKITDDMEAKETNYSAFRKRVDTISKKDLRKILKHGYQAYRQN